MAKKVLSFMLSVVMLACIAIIPGQVKAPVADAVSFISEDGGYTMPAIEVVVELYHTYTKFMRLITGSDDYSEEHYNLTVDAAFMGIVNGIYNKSGINFSDVFTRLPETKQYAEYVTGVLGLDIPKTQDRLNTLCHSLEKMGLALPGGMVRLVSAWLGIVDSCVLGMEETDDPDMLELILTVTYRDGRSEVIHPPFYYNTKTQIFTSKDGGPVFLGFYLDAANASIYTGRDVWQRNLGYCFLYDLICFTNPFFIGFDTERIKFDYNNQQWMIQIWKGRYFITNGAEIGVYTRPMGSIGSFYNCANDDETLDMSLTLSRGDETLFEIEKQDAWWLNKFNLSEKAYLPDAFTLTSVVTMKDEEMLDAVTKSLDTHSNISYTVDGLDVTIVW